MAFSLPWLCFCPSWTFATLLKNHLPWLCAVKNRVRPLAIRAILGSIRSLPGYITPKKTFLGGLLTTSLVAILNTSKMLPLQHPYSSKMTVLGRHLHFRCIETGLVSSPFPALAFITLPTVTLWCTCCCVKQSSYSHGARLCMALSARAATSRTP